MCEREKLFICLGCAYRPMASNSSSSSMHVVWLALGILLKRLSRQGRLGKAVFR